MATLNPYVNFNGNTEEAFLFYRSVFGGEFMTLMRFKDTPMASSMPPSAQEKIMHVSLPIGKGNVLMGTDALEELGQHLKFGENMSLSLECESKEEVDRIYNGLAVGGTIDEQMKLGDTFWGAYFGMVVDKFGIRWMVSYTYPKQ